MADVNATLAFPLPHRATQVTLRAVTAIKARRCSVYVLPFSLRLVPSLAVLDLVHNMIETLPSPSSSPEPGLVLASVHVEERARIMASALGRLRRVDLRDNPRLGKVTTQAGGFADATTEQMTWFLARLPQLEVIDLRLNKLISINATALSVHAGLKCVGSSNSVRQNMLCCGRQSMPFAREEGDPTFCTDTEDTQR